MESHIQGLFAERIGGNGFGKDTQIYKFERIKRAKQRALAAHPNTPVIDLGVGEPDWAADPGVVAKLTDEAGKAENRFYADNGIPEFRTAATSYMERVFGVHGIDPETQLVHAIGSKPALAMLPQAFINDGDYALVTVPGYPVTATHTRYCGGRVHELPLLPENGFLPDLAAVPKDVLSRAKLLYINYPNNPTGASATSEFFAKVVDFARRYNLVVVHDAAYAALTFNGAKPLSFLATPGAIDVGVEVQSLSKAFNMTGWRMGFVVGNPLVIKAYATIKDNYDSGQFRAIQKAAVYALEHPEITAATNAKYERRHAMLASVLSAAGFCAKAPHASFYQYLAIPRGTRTGREFHNAEEFSEFLLEEKLISTVPWDDAGAFVRMSVTFTAGNEEEEKAVVEEVGNRLTSADLVF